VISWTARIVLAAALAGVSVTRSPGRHSGHQSTGIVIVTGQQATAPVPTLIEGAQNTTANQDIADQLFLRLVGLGPSLETVGDRGFVPLLAKSWSRRDSLTLVFELDPRARWHDGTAVGSRDVVFTMRRARDSTIAPRLANVTRRIAGVEAEGDHRVVVRFRQAYAEQLYDATFHTAILPAHLLERLPPTAGAWASFAARPVGSGPYRWVRRQASEFVELAANQDFFLGPPAIKRVIFRVAVSPDARLNLLLSGEADATENIPPPFTNVARVEATKHLRVIPVPSSNLGYLVFNQRDPADTSRPHAILTDPAVRRALVLALDRELLVRALLGRYGKVPFGPVSSQLWISHGTPAPARPDQATARRLLEGRGWMDRDQDGVREDRSGRPLALRLQVTASSQQRGQMALIIQEQLRQVGVRLEVVRLEPAVVTERRAAGQFDLDFSSATQDPSPSGLAHSWSCKGPGNAGYYCDPGADSLLFRAIGSPVADRRLWHDWLLRVEANAPAVFLYSQIYVAGVHRRFREVTIRPVSPWGSLWRWPVPRT
jgi:peptide/nickel transport system substrate-binding protein